MQECLCSNCHPDLVTSFLECQPHATTLNFDSLVTSKDIRTMPVTNGWTMHPIQCNKSISEAVLPCAANEVIRKNSLLVSLGNELQQSFLSLYETTYPAGNCYVGPQHMFTDVHVWKIIKNYQLLRNGASLRLIFGSEPIKGTFKLILENLELWSRRDDFGIYL
ncbi:hypothetical protein DFH28DRAFT_866149, partial [Melampsora americana]